MHAIVFCVCVCVCVSLCTLANVHILISSLPYDKLCWNNETREIFFNISNDILSNVS